MTRRQLLAAAAALPVAAKVTRAAPDVPVAAPMAAYYFALTGGRWTQIDPPVFSAVEGRVYVVDDDPLAK